MGKKRLFRGTANPGPTYLTTCSFVAFRRRARGWVGGVALLGAVGMTDCLAHDTGGTAPLPDAQIDLRVDTRPDSLPDTHPRGLDQQEPDQGSGDR